MMNNNFNWWEDLLVDNPNYLADYLMIHNGYGDSAAIDSLPSNDMESGYESAISAVHQVRRSRSTGANPRRKRQSSGSSSGAKRTKKWQSFSGNVSEVEEERNSAEPHVEEASASHSQQLEPEGNEKSSTELIEEKPATLKNLRDKADRQKKKGINEENTYLWLFKHLVDQKRYAFAQEISTLLDQFRQQWPMPPQLQEIYEELGDIKQQAGNGKMKSTVVKELEKKIEMFKEQYGKYSEKIKNCEELIFKHKDVDDKTLRVQLSETIPPHLWEIIATNKPNADQNQGTLQTPEQGEIAMPTVDQRSLQTEEEVQFNQLFDKEVDDSCFDKEMRNLDNLEPFARTIRQELGKDAAFELPMRIQLLVCAVTKQMEDLRVKELKWDTLLSWGAVLNYARKSGFQMKFAEILLKRYFYAYLGFEREG
ncbi:hypothetical protein PTKIN_Ptkin06aG0059200 [Pterospermum kingtungense]